MDVARKADGTRIGRWNCHDCKSSFNVLHGTIFQKTKIPLQKWFLAIGIIFNAKKGVSSCQLARDLSINQKSAWYLGMRVRVALKTDTTGLLSGIVEADECYVGGKPRWNAHDPLQRPPRGRGTKKLPIVGVVERGGRVVARPAAKRELTAKGLKRFILDHVNPTGTVLMTDEYPGYQQIATVMQHAVIKHKRHYVDGDIHTNTIEGFWSLVKRAWFGSHHHYRSTYAPLYLAETCASYNNRHVADRFEPFLRSVLA